MAEYIRREDAIKCIEGQCVDGKMWGNDESEGTLIEAYSAIDDLMEIPPADVAPVVHGRWTHLGGDEWCCSACGFVITTEGSWDNPTKKHCEDCGAKMDGGADNA